MAKGKKQKPKKRVARRVDDELETQGAAGADDDAEGAEESEETAGDEGASSDGGDSDGDSDGDSEDDSEDDSDTDAAPEPVAARDPRPEPKSAQPSRERAPQSGKAKSAPEPSEMPITQTSNNGGVYFLVVVFSLLGGAILLGLLTG